MLKPTCTYISFDCSTVIEKFEELSGWESTQLGEWNCKFDKPVTFQIDFYENHTFQHEQDYVYIHPYCPSEPDDPNTLPIKLQEIKDNGTKKLSMEKLYILFHLIPLSNTYKNKKNCQITLL
ncbi:MAG: hypothetical protein RLY43_2153 [Bacteroidota bacterium]|jgi:hypothetical protein